MISSITTNHIQSNKSFKALTIKNPEKMPPEILKSLDNVKGLFDRFPNASVKLKTKNNIGIYSEYMPSETLYGIGNKVRHTLHFNLGKDKNNKNIGKFSVSGHKNTYNWAASIFENIIDALLACKHNSFAKKIAFRRLNGHLSELEIQSHIKWAIRDNSEY